MEARKIERRDIDRLIFAKMAYEQEVNSFRHGSLARVERTSYQCSTKAELKAIAQAVKMPWRVGNTDASGNPTTIEVEYNGCTFYAPVFNWME